MQELEQGVKFLRTKTDVTSLRKNLRKNPEQFVLGSSVSETLLMFYEEDEFYKYPLRAWIQQYSIFYIRIGASSKIEARIEFDKEHKIFKFCTELEKGKLVPRINRRFLFLVDDD